MTGRGRGCSFWRASDAVSSSGASQWVCFLCKYLLSCTFVLCVLSECISYFNFQVYKTKKHVRSSHSSTQNPSMASISFQEKVKVLTITSQLCLSWFIFSDFISYYTLLCSLAFGATGLLALLGRCRRAPAFESLHWFLFLQIFMQPIPSPSLNFCSTLPFLQGLS